MNSFQKTPRYGVCTFRQGITNASQVEIEAKINSGYFSARQIPIDLETVKGRGWTVPQASLASVTNIYEDLDH